jgi:hypothetical protein
MPDLVADYVELERVADRLPETTQSLRYHIDDLPTERTDTGRIYVEREYALQLLDERPKCNNLADTIAHLQSGSLR